MAKGFTKTSRNVQEPVTEATNGRGATEEKTTHPAFAQISASRVSGRQVLYGSDFVHQHFITLRIQTSEMGRSLNRDWHFAGKHLIEVAMSESQWATFVSSLNMGGGVPCTLEYFNGQSIPGLPDPKPRVDQFSAELNERMQDVVARVDALIAGAKTKSQESELKLLKQAILNGLPWVASSFAEHAEDTVEAAKQEIHGYMTAVVQRAGLTALTDGTLPLQLAAPEETPADE